MPEALAILVAHLERAFSSFAQVPYHDARTQEEFEQLLDDLDNW
jgi:hypothetical protein